MRNQRNLHKNDPMVACLPPGVPRANLGGSRGMPHPFKVVQTPTLVVFLYETSTNQTFRQGSSTAVHTRLTRNRRGWATRSDVGKATRSSSKPPASTVGRGLIP